MHNTKQVLSAAFLLMTGAFFGYILARMVLSLWHKNWHIGPFFIPMNYITLYKAHFLEWLVSTLMVVMPCIGSLLLRARQLERNVHCLRIGTTGNGKQVGFEISNLQPYLADAVFIDARAEHNGNGDLSAVEIRQ